MKIRAFHGLRYSGDAPNAGANAAPPYDQINPEQRDVFHQRAHHFAHLIRPVAAGDLHAHDNSSRLHSSWLADGITLRDSACCLYANSIESPTGETRYGLTTLIDIETPESAIIRPHEETVEKTVAERLDLLRKTGIDYEPILVLANDRGDLDTLLAADCTGPSLADHTDEFGNIHRLYAIGTPERIEAYREALDESYGLIADGHHRYKTGRLFASEGEATRGRAAAAKLGVITSLSSSALAIEPIHRALPTRLDPARLAGVCLQQTRWTGTSGSQLAEAVAQAPQPTLALLSSDGSALLCRLDPRRGPRDLPEAASDLSVVLLHRTLFPLWGIAASAATDGTVKYRSDPDDLLESVTGGDFPSGIVLPPMTPDGFAAGIADGDVLPPKSTRFLPKVVSGLVWASHSDPID